MGSFSAQLTSVRQMAITLRDARIAKGLTQAQLADRIGVSRPWISQFEQGKVLNPSFQRVMAMINALHVAVTMAYEVPNQIEPDADMQPAESHSGDSDEQPAGNMSIFVPNAKIDDFNDILLALAERSVAVRRQAAELDGNGDA